MATKGQLAKEAVINKIATAFGSDYIGEFDKKAYVYANDGNNGIIQIAISLTCPKNPIGGVEVAATPSNPHEWGDSPTMPEPVKPAEISAEEEATIAEMMKRLGL